MHSAIQGNMLRISGYVQIFFPVSVNLTNLIVVTNQVLYVYFNHYC